MRLAAAVVVAAIAVLAVAGISGVLERRDATNDVGRAAAPFLLGTQRLYVALADADAAASTILLRAGLEPPELRDRYRSAIRVAGDELAGVAGQPELPPAARAAITTIAEQLPVYTGRVEAARANSRLEHPVGAAYQRRASELMRTTILPAATSLYDVAARQLDADAARGTSPRAATALLVLGVLTVTILAGAQILLAVQTRRLINVGLTVATVLVVGAVVVALVQLDRHREALNDAQRDGADRVLTLGIARILSLRSLSDENLFLIERGTELEYLADFEAQVTAIAGDDGTGGLLARAAASAPDGTAADGIAATRATFARYLAAHDEVRRLDDAGAYVEAVEAAVTTQADAAARLDRDIADQIELAAAALGDDVSRARAAVRWLPAALATLAAVAALAVVAGLQPRLREYR